MNEALNKAKTLVEFIETLLNFYDLQNNKPSKMILTMLATAIKTATNITDKSVIEASLKSITLYDFLMTFARYYDLQNSELSNIHKQKLMQNINNVVNLTRLKKR